MYMSECYTVHVHVHVSLCMLYCTRTCTCICLNVTVHVHVIVVPWVSSVYGICTLSAVICIPEGGARGRTYNSTKGTNTYTQETHGTADLYRRSIL